MAASARPRRTLATAALLATAVLVLAAAAPATATHPGRNGALAFGASRMDDETTDIAYESFYVGIAPLHRRGRHLFAPGATPAFSPDGRWIAYADADEYQSYGIWLAHHDCPRAVRRSRPRPCSRVRRLTRGDDVSPTFSPSGSRVAFDGGDRIYITGVNGGRTRFLAKGWGPDWSSRGVVAFVRPGGEGIRSRRPGGDKTRVLTRIGLSPSWAPTGDRLVFTVANTFDPNAGLYVINSDGSGLRRIWPRGAVIEGTGPVAHAPAWSPDGRRIAFVKGDDLFTGSIYSIRPNGRGLRLLSPSPANCRTCVRDLMFNDLSWQPRVSRR
jgi:Tol biopolymer transport system component